MENIENKEIKESISIDEKDYKILEKVKFRRDESEKLHNKKSKEWESNLKFFDGEHWEVAKVSLPTYKADTVINKFFAAVRSLVAFETDAKPDPEVEARISTTDANYQEIVDKTKKIESMLDYRWGTDNVPNILTEIYYDRYIFDDGWGMYFWNAEIDDVDFEQIKPSELMFAPGATCVDDAEYIIIQKYRNRKWFEDNYPDAKVKFEAPKEAGLKTSEMIDYENMAKVYHYLDDEIWIFFTEDEILDKMQNPNWEWRSEEEQKKEIEEKIGQVPIDWSPVKNHLLRPQKPIIHFKGYHLGGELYSRSLIKQVAGLSFAIDKRKCQIQDNADAVGNGQWLIDPSIPLKDVSNITSQAGLKIRINPAMAQKIMGTPLPEFVFTDLQHSEAKFDDMMGHHEISRGASSSKRQTAREAMLLRETDITPVRLLMRNSEEAIEKLLNGWVQLMKLFYDIPHYVGKSGGAGLRDSSGQMLLRNEIPDSLSIKIKVGSSLPTSRETKRLEYQEDLARGVLDPLTYLELMEYPNPKKILQRVVNYQQGIIGEETQAPQPKQ